MLTVSNISDQDNRAVIDTNAIGNAEQTCPKISPNGFLHGFTLANFLQYVEMDEKSWTLHILADEKSGVLYFRDGLLLDAHVDGKNGEEAALEILSWDRVDIDVEDACRINSPKTSLPLRFLLFEATRLMDENA